jgi:hypothetical protein
MRRRIHRFGISFAILIAASVISENERTTIEQGLSTAMINVMDSIEPSTQF